MKRSILFFFFISLTFYLYGQVWHSNRHYDKVFRFAFGYPPDWQMLNESGYFELFPSVESKAKFDGLVSIEPVYNEENTAEDFFFKLVEDKYEKKFSEYNLLQWGNLMVNGASGKWGVFRYETEPNNVIFCHIYVLKRNKRMFLVHTYTKKENHELNGGLLRAIVQSLKID